MFDIAKSLKKIIEKRESKKKNLITGKEEKLKSSNKYYFAFAFFNRRIYILLENIFWKTSFILLHLYYSFLS